MMTIVFLRRISLMEGFGKGIPGVSSSAPTTYLTTDNAIEGVRR